jgi:hypothetical protein
MTLAVSYTARYAAAAAWGPPSANIATHRFALAKNPVDGGVNCMETHCRLVRFGRVDAHVEKGYADLLVGGHCALLWCW